MHCYIENLTVITASVFVSAGVHKLHNNFFVWF